MNFKNYLILISFVAISSSTASQLKNWKPTTSFSENNEVATTIPWYFNASVQPCKLIFPNQDHYFMPVQPKHGKPRFIYEIKSQLSKLFQETCASPDFCFMYNTLILDGLSDKQQTWLEYARYNRLKPFLIIIEQDQEGVIRIFSKYTPPSQNVKRKIFCIQPQTEPYKGISIPFNCPSGFIPPFPGNDQVISLSTKSSRTDSPLFDPSFYYNEPSSSLHTYVAAPSHQSATAKPIQPTAPRRKFTFVSPKQLNKNIKNKIEIPLVSLAQIPPSSQTDQTTEPQEQPETIQPSTLHTMMSPIITAQPDEESKIKTPALFSSIPQSILLLPDRKKSKIKKVTFLLPTEQNEQNKNTTEIPLVSLAQLPSSNQNDQIIEPHEQSETEIINKTENNEQQVLPDQQEEEKEEPVKTLAQLRQEKQKREKQQKKQQEINKKKKEQAQREKEEAEKTQKELLKKEIEKKRKEEQRQEEARKAHEEAEKKRKKEQKAQESMLKTIEQYKTYAEQGEFEKIPSSSFIIPEEILIKLKASALVTLIKNSQSESESLKVTHDRVAFMEELRKKLRQSDNSRPEIRTASCYALISLITEIDDSQIQDFESCFDYIFNTLNTDLCLEYLKKICITLLKKITIFYNPNNHSFHPQVKNWVHMFARHYSKLKKFPDILEKESCNTFEFIALSLEVWNIIEAYHNPNPDTKAHSSFEPQKIQEIKERIEKYSQQYPDFLELIKLLPIDKEIQQQLWNEHEVFTTEIKEWEKELDRFWQEGLANNNTYVFIQYLKRQVELSLTTFTGNLNPEHIEHKKTRILKQAMKKLDEKEGIKIQKDPSYTYIHLGILLLETSLIWVEDKDTLFDSLILLNREIKKVTTIINDNFSKNSDLIDLLKLSPHFYTIGTAQRYSGRDGAVAKNDIAPNLENPSINFKTALRMLKALEPVESPLYKTLSNYFIDLLRDAPKKSK
mgnify:CR=1 FL=1